MAGLGKSPYGDSYGDPSDPVIQTPGGPGTIAVDDVEQNAFAIAFPLQFGPDADVALVPEEVGVNDDIRTVVFIREGGVPLFPFGVGMDDFVFDILDFPDQVFLADRIAESARLGIPYVRVLEEQIQFDNSQKEQNKTRVYIPYSNLKTGKDNVALLSVPRQRIDK